MQANRTHQILVVEDNPTDVYLIREALREHQVEHELMVLDDGEKAIRHLEALDGHPPDLIILDIHIPKHDGLEVLGEYRTNAALLNVPIVMLTSSDSAVDRKRAKTIGANAYLEKPLTLDGFLALGKRFKMILDPAL